MNIVGSRNIFIPYSEYPIRTIEKPHKAGRQETSLGNFFDWFLCCDNVSNLRQGELSRGLHLEPHFTTQNNFAELISSASFL